MHCWASQIINREWSEWSELYGEGSLFFVPRALFFVNCVLFVAI